MYRIFIPNSDVWCINNSALRFLEFNIFYELYDE